MEKRENIKTKILKKPRKLTQIIKNKKRLEKRKIEIEKKEKEILERERLERERIEKERLERERLERERFEKLERLERIMRERERLEREKAKIEKERKELIKEINNKYDYVKDDLPVPFFIDENKLEKLKNSNNERCLICLDNFIIKNQVLYLPCSHLFHSFCIMRWLLQNNKCPICLVDYRGDIEEKEDNEDIGRYYEELFNDISMMEDIRLFNYNNILERNNNFLLMEIILIDQEEEVFGMEIIIIEEEVEEVGIIEGMEEDIGEEEVSLEEMEEIIIMREGILEDKEDFKGGEELFITDLIWE